ncbi:alpha/beta fold hydrolase (plasmid) [Rathayibacter sp. VKM Ac-2803]|uniref:AB hydrolase-1 domain-containing protein n=1 Tax=Rathayibacter caricis DSM 15933 TaxID=1328867 RepID=A0A2T4UP36_9MICO|nr:MULTISPECIES: alpha/beta hydrolase [Rathayibacter]MWV51467.1 alpha/beta fold hydrolase [Rathayibacter sp. VKM Ac-2803]PTL71292.1 hypothetical protein C1I63_18880 [Rathayibacter caricis DSM 15933]
MTDDDTTYLFLSGAGLPGWIWDDVRAMLPDRSCSLVGPRPVQSRARIRDHADAAVGGLAGTGPVVVIAHSIGGGVAGHVAARLGDRVRGIVAVSAVMPKPGRSFLSALPLPQRVITDLVMRLAGTRPPASAVRAGVAAGLHPDLTERLIADMVAESPRLFRDPAAALGARSARYVITARDRELPVALQRRSARELGAPSLSLPTGHLPMLEAPEAIAAVISEVEAEWRDHSPRCPT